MSKPAHPTLDLMALRFAAELRAIEPFPPAQRLAELGERMRTRTVEAAAVAAGYSVSPTSGVMAIATSRTDGPAVPGLSCRRALQVVGSAITPSPRPLPASGSLEF